VGDSRRGRGREGGGGVVGERDGVKGEIREGKETGR
jgi:hypothetical protein